MLTDVDGWDGGGGAGEGTMGKYFTFLKPKFLPESLGAYGTKNMKDSNDSCNLVSKYDNKLG